MRTASLAFFFSLFVLFTWTSQLFPQPSTIKISDSFLKPIHREALLRLPSPNPYSDGKKISDLELLSDCLQLDETSRYAMIVLDETCRNNPQAAVLIMRHLEPTGKQQYCFYNVGNWHTPYQNDLYKVLLSKVETREMMANIVLEAKNNSSPISTHQRKLLVKIGAMPGFQKKVIQALGTKTFEPGFGEITPGIEAPRRFGIEPSYDQKEVNKYLHSWIQYKANSKHRKKLFEQFIAELDQQESFRSTYAREFLSAVPVEKQYLQACLKLLQDKNQEKVDLIIQTFENSAPAYQSEICKLLGSKDSLIVVNALRCLTAMKANEPKTQQSITKICREHPDEAIRLWALKYFTAVPWQSAAVLDSTKQILTKNSQTQDQTEVTLTLRALLKTQSLAAELVPPIKKIAQDPNHPLSELALAVLIHHQKIKLGLKDAVKKFAEHVKSQDFYQQPSSNAPDIWLQRYGKAAIPHLIPLLESKNRELVQQTFELIFKIDFSNQQALKSLEQILQKQHRHQFVPGENLYEDLIALYARHQIDEAQVVKAIFPLALKEWERFDPAENSSPCGFCNAFPAIRLINETDAPLTEFRGNIEKLFLKRNRVRKPQLDSLHSTIKIRPLQRRFLIHWLARCEKLSEQVKMELLQEKKQNPNDLDIILATSTFANKIEDRVQSLLHLILDTVSLKDKRFADEALEIRARACVMLCRYVKQIRNRKEIIERLDTDLVIEPDARVRRALLAILLLCDNENKEHQKEFIGLLSGTDEPLFSARRFPNELTLRISLQLGHHIAFAKKSIDKLRLHPDPMMRQLTLRVLKKIEDDLP